MNNYAAFAGMKNINTLRVSDLLFSTNTKCSVYGINLFHRFNSHFQLINFYEEHFTIKLTAKGEKQLLNQFLIRQTHFGINA
jgi:hypothetical protein